MTQHPETMEPIGEAEKPALVPAHERTYESALATRIAGVKLILAVLNIVVLLVHFIIPAVGTTFAVVQSLTIAGTFLAYMLITYLALKQGWVSLRFYRITIPFVDVLFCALLILGTDGYNSPFQLWLAMALVAASYGSDQRVVLSATALAVVLDVLIAFVPQNVPLDVHVFVVRTGFLFGFGLVIASIGNYIARKSSLLVAIDSFASRIALCDSVAEAADTVIETLMQFLRLQSATLDLDDGSRYSQGDAKLHPPTIEVPVASGDAQYGSLKLAPSDPLTSDDERLLHMIGDRFALALRRLVAAEEMRRSAIQEARLRLADELHDTHVQTLTAIDFQIEALFADPKLATKTKTELQRMRGLARKSIADLRDFIANGPIESTDDLEQIVAANRANWTGTFEFTSSENLSLTRGAWIAIGILLREGLSNAKRHGHADWASFSLERKAGMCIATLQTNGLPPDLPLKRQGYGLTRVTAAVSGAGGQMFFAERPEGGASLSAVFAEMTS